MTRIYIAGPMSGRPNYNHPAFAAAAELLAGAGHEPVSPVHDDDLEADGSARHPWEWYVRRDLREMLECDGVALLDGWEESQGATLEQSLARQVRIPTKPLRAWLGATAAQEAADG